MTNRPSLFGHAPGELSQDALLAWLIEWADPSFADVDPALHRAGRSLLDKLFLHAEAPVADLGQVRSVRVLRQHHKIDVFVVVNEELNRIALIGSHLT